MTAPDPNAPFLDRIVASKRELKAAIPDLARRFAALGDAVRAQVEAIES